MNINARSQRDNVDELRAPVSALVRRVAQTVILPRFRQLRACDVMEKTPGEVVTIADQESEELLSRELLAILPGSRVIGEEASASNPSLLDGLDRGLVWIVDPLDGTANFAAGQEPFGVIIALALDGITLAAWLYNPVTDRMCYAALGRGACVAQGGGADHWLRVSDPNVRPIAALATQFMLEPVRNAVAEAAGASFDLHPIPRCAAEHYPLLCRGENHIALFQRTLPWDHAAGALLLSEAGGHVARWNGMPYRFYDDGLGIIAATSRRLWEQAADFAQRCQLEAQGHCLPASTSHPTP